jgi:uncharacterized protein (TIGR03382 family)
MTNRHHSVILASSIVLIGVTSLLVSMPTADACTPPRCEGGTLREAGATIPANAEAVVWRPRTQSGRQPEVGPSNIQVMEDDGWGLNEVSVSVERATDIGPNTFLIKPEGGFEPDNTYRFSGADFCDDDGSLEGEHSYRESFDTGSEASDPSSLGTLELAESKRGSMTTWGQGGMCESTVEAEHRTLNLNASAGAEPWDDTLMYRTEVRLPGDDQYGEWTSWSLKPNLSTWDVPDGASQNFDLPRTNTVNVPAEGAWLYRVCDEDRSGGLPEGRWKVRMEAYRPATGDTWTSNTVEVPLSCGELPPPSADTGVGADAGDVGESGNSAWPGGRNSDGGCSTTGPGSPSGATLMFAVALLAFVRRRRR